MSAMTLFYVAIIVFSLMITGLFLSVREFLRTSSEPSLAKETARPDVASRDFTKNREAST